MPDETPSSTPDPSGKEPRSPGSFLGYQYPEWLFILLVMFLPLIAALFQRPRNGIAMLGWMLLFMAAGFVLWILAMLIIFKLYERREKQRSRS
ncbi:MAG TPA: hypothetical protein VK699_08250 [Terriglobales bacterium]|jgi:hypothetical protein|nr:hypothetical protein [Terriglobales bacterium]